MPEGQQVAGEQVGALLVVRRDAVHRLPVDVPARHDGRDAPRGEQRDQRRLDHAADHDGAVQPGEKGLAVRRERLRVLPGVRHGALPEAGGLDAGQDLGEVRVDLAGGAGTPAGFPAMTPTTGRRSGAR